MEDKTKHILTGSVIGIVGTYILFSHWTNKAMCKICNDPIYIADPTKFCNEVKDKNKC